MDTHNQDMRGKVCLVTGATAGIGEATAYLLAQLGATLVGIGRNPTKNENSTRMIKEKSGNPNVEYLLADLSSQQDIRAVAQEFKNRYDRLDVLVNNAGATFAKRQQSVDGIEMTFALNHLGYFLLTKLLCDLLEKSAPARIINVSSSLHKLGKLDLQDIPFTKGYSRGKAYQRSKLANIAFTYELARRIHGQNVTVNAMNPGLVATNVGEAAGGISAILKRLVDKIAGMPPEEGAQTIIYLATSPEVIGVTGKYFVKEKSIPSSKKSYDLALGRQLWEISEDLVG
ncbi:MAG: SDR family NAD(P)-dependent oxidoreductase [Chloroflexi bacterium]|nr:MAG: SDR family NAD(P)-dependent oxidoreductase [Chloroflexota bacterium]MBL1197445.1 SDR family oxidoreductase [Chloroflexota bacterium]NOH14740.1 SDR family oxidoreductase [Chloroflexota bacterium]